MKKSHSFQVQFGRNCFQDQDHISKDALIINRIKSGHKSFSRRKLTDLVHYDYELYGLGRMKVEVVMGLGV